MKKYGILGTLTLSILAVQSFAASSLHSLDDEQMRQATGQALLYMGTTAGSSIDSNYNSKYGNISFYKMGLQADLEANLNIKKLQLGCGGINGANGCDIDIENLALTGVPTSVASDGTPIWNYSGTSGVNERAASSAILRNPFIEFAIKNPQSASTREMTGVRLSAEGIKGYMTAGTNNDQPNTPASQLNQGGINTFSGYIVTDPVDVTASTQAAKFGLTRDQMIYAPVYINALGVIYGYRTAYTAVDKMNPSSNNYQAPPSGVSSWGINIAQKDIKFIFPQTVVTGNRMSQLNLKVDNVPVGRIAVGASDGPIYMQMDDSIASVNNATFYMGESGSRSWTVRDTSDPWLTTNSDGLTPAQKQQYNTTLRNFGVPTGQMGCLNSSNAASNTACTFIDNLAANVSVQQDFKRMHNLPVAKAIKDASGKITGYDFNKGFYLSLQKEALRWPGSNSDDIAQRGWWMSFSEPLNFGALEPQTKVSMDDVLPQVATFINNFFSQQKTDSAGNPLYAKNNCSFICIGQPGWRSQDGVNLDYREETTTAAGSFGPIGKNFIALNTGDALNALFGAPLYKSIGIIDVKGVPAVMGLSDLPLSNYQAVVPNCWGGLKFC
ncbi:MULTISPECIES: hypothetical protein [Acinetobacter]|uniref:Uncharacterized protein n=1 Tax=Acinetobacter higginsii TaxID=70347 RepID=N9RTM7_9GAMM|nr:MULTISPECIES: hypothetical protein [Acinetobacter]ENX55062.1 hypothetical protein F902_03672 [Acinetobacter higginsii]ENX61309.1 hypothetical protein F885_01709 [Acinetobacter higginsii]MCH7303216.1 hypothetical protein [Acinetobacter higginsii]MCH7318792.1 hypothetical protein [Acinetobacter higginsii]MCH7338081.1 hypothetical protein [Acinetobacter higginsii]